MRTLTLGKVPNAAPAAASRSLGRDALHHLLRNRSAQIGLIRDRILLIVAIFAPFIAPHDPITFRAR